jgi:hypothetical protein
MVTEVPWKTLPISEPVLPGEESAERQGSTGYPIYVLALISVIASISTSEARRLVEQGRVTIDGIVVGPTFFYLKPGALVSIAGSGLYRIGHPT